MTITATAPAVPSSAPVRASVVFGVKPAISAQNIACDRCPTARAKGRVLFEEGPLYLCGHHLRTGWDHLMRTALEIAVDIPGDGFYLPGNPA